MSRALSLARAIGSDGVLNVGDVAGLAAVASSGSASDLGTGTLPNARLASGAAVANLGYTPVNKAGDTMSGNLAASAFHARSREVPYTAVSETASGAMSVFSHNAKAHDSTSNRVIATNTGYHGHFIRMYYNHGISFHTSVNPVSAGDVLYDSANPASVVAGVDSRFNIDPNGRVTMPYQPAFDAYNFTPVTARGAIGWGAVRFNTGNHFSTATGLFTAPVSGVYNFNFSILMQASGLVAYQRILFNVNGTQSTNFFDSLQGGVVGESGGAYEGYNYISVTGSKTTKLAAGDTVGLWNDSPHPSWNTGGYGHFSGHLVG